MFRPDLAPVKTWLTAFCVCLLSACGGGASLAVDLLGLNEARITITADPATLQAETVEGYPFSVDVFLRYRVSAPTETYFIAYEGNGWAAPAKLQAGSDTAGGSVQFAGTLPVGTHVTALRVRACSDANCSKEFPGSPVSVPVRVLVKPQIKIQTPEPIRRVGRETAATQTLAVDFKPEMGTFSYSTSGNTQAFDLQVASDRIVVKPLKVRAGHYNARIQLAGTASNLYRAAIDLSYTVLPPEGGELPLTVEPSGFRLAMTQGTVQTHRFRVTPPTWTDELDPITITDTKVLRAVRSLGDGEYEMTLDSRVDPGTVLDRVEFSSVVIRAGDTGGVHGLAVSVDINPPLILTEPLPGWYLTNETRLADLRYRSGVQTPDQMPARWSVTSDQAWLKVIQATGITGVDDVVVDLDPSVVDLPQIDAQARLTFELDRPGTLPLVQSVTVRNQVPRFDMASPAVPLNARARVRLHGNVFYLSQYLSQGKPLRIEGATLEGFRLESDPSRIRFAGFLSLDLANMVAGQPVTIGTFSELRPTQVVLNPLAPPRVPAAFTPLPYGRYRPPSYAPGLRTLAFAGTDTIWRWQHDTAWAPPQASPMAGLLDVDWAPDESVLYATVGRRTVKALTSRDLQVLREGALSVSFETELDDELAPGASGLRFSIDGQALAALSPTGSYSSYGKNFSVLSGCGSADVWSDIATVPCSGVGSRRPLGPVGPVLTRSAGGGVVMGTFSDGKTQIYRNIDPGLQDGVQLPPGRSVLAVADEAQWMVRDDGVLFSPSLTTYSVNLNEVVPAGHVAKGFAVSGDGRFVAVYGYRIAVENGVARARDAALYLVTLSTAMSPSRLVADTTIALPDAVGCNTALAPEETCEHNAHVLVARGDLSLFVLGPRGLVATPVPASFSALLNTGVGARRPAGAPQRSRGR